MHTRLLQNMPKLLLFLLLLTGCTYDKKEIEADTQNYPPQIANIILNKCATSGCHNESSYSNADGILMSNYANLFKGSDHGAVIIPFRPDQSSLLFFTNTYKDLGLMAAPTMPLYGTPLSREEIKTLQDWIGKGAPDAKGNLYYPDDINRAKIYVSNQGCDIVYVLDAATRLPMRAIDVGKSPAIEAPHQVKISPDGQYWYAVFYQGTVLQQFSTANDMLLRTYEIGSGGWSTVALSADNKMAYVMDLNTGKIAFLDLETGSYSYLTKMANPHGCVLVNNDKTLYVSAQTGNFLYKIDVSDPSAPVYKQISLDGKPISYLSSIDPHEVLFSSDQSRYYVTCQKSNDVRIFNTSNDSLIGSVKTGIFPQEMAYSKKQNLLFVTCTDDSLNAPVGTKGTVTVIDISSMSALTTLYGFYQPHGIACDDASGLVYVANRNVSPSGPAPHHASACGGRNGFMQLIDPSTLKTIGNYKVELSTDPYSMVYHPGKL